MSRCGYIALIGAPNAGKSTLLNALLQKKISIVSHKPHTTRKRVLGISTIDDVQIVFLDTPGFSTQSGLKAIPWDACAEADVICYLIDITNGWPKDTSSVLNKLNTFYQKKIFIIGTKTDKLKKNVVSNLNQEFQKKLDEFKLSCTTTVTDIDHASTKKRENLINFELFMLSAKKKEDIQFLLSLFSKNMPKSEWLYPKDSATDNTEDFICSELIREQLLRQLSHEIPYQATVIIDKLENLIHFVSVHATIIVLRESHKAIVIGRGGSRLKQIGQVARESLEKYFGKKIYLKIYIKQGAI